jgi:hypothetical protein
MTHTENATPEAQKSDSAVASLLRDKILPEAAP